MLVLKLKRQSRIQIGEDIIVTILERDRGGVSLGIEAPKELRIERIEPLAERRPLERGY